MSAVKDMMGDPSNRVPLPRLAIVKPLSRRMPLQVGQRLQSRGIRRGHGL